MTGWTINHRQLLELQLLMHQKRVVHWKVSEILLGKSRHLLKGIRFLNQTNLSPKTQQSYHPPHTQSPRPFHHPLYHLPNLTPHPNQNTPPVPLPATYTARCPTPVPSPPQNPQTSQSPKKAPLSCSRAIATNQTAGPTDLQTGGPCPLSTQTLSTASLSTSKQPDQAAVSPPLRPSTCGHVASVPSS